MAELEVRARELGRIFAESAREVLTQRELPATAVSSGPPPGSYLNAWLRKKVGVPGGDDRQLFDKVPLEAEICLPLSVRGQAFSDVLTRVSHGTLVPVTVGEPQVALKAFAVTRNYVTVQQSDTLPTINVPIFDDTANRGAHLTASAGISTSTITKPDFQTLTLGARTIHSGIIPISKSMLLDASFNLEQFVVRLMMERIGRELNRAITVGSGTNEPTGVVTAAPQKLTGIAGQVGYDDLVDVLHEIDPAYRSKAIWMMHPNIKAYLMKLKDSEGRPLLVYDHNLGLDRLLGHPVVENPAMASSVQAGNAVLVVGDLSVYLLRERSYVRVRVLEEVYVQWDAVGILCLYDYDAGLAATSNTSALRKLVVRGSS